MERNKRPKPRQSKLRTRAQVGSQSKRLNSLCFVPDRKPPRTIEWKTAQPESFHYGKVACETKIGGVTLDKGDVIMETAFEKNGEEGGVTMSAVIEETRSPVEFINKALELEVPWKGQPTIPDYTLQTIVDTLTRSLKENSTRWLDQVKMLERRMKELRAEESKAREHLHPFVDLSLIHI